MEADPPWLPTTAYAVLGLLALGREHTAYDLKQRADESIAHIYWAPAMSAVYTELQRLEQLGLVRHRLAAQTDSRSRRLYRITARGRQRLRSWVEDGVHEPTVVKNTTLLRLLFGGGADPEALAARLEEHAAWSRAQLTRLQWALEEARVAEPPGNGQSMSTMVLEASVATAQTEARVSRDLARQVRMSLGRSR